MKILITADMVPTASNSSLFRDGNVEKLFGEEVVGIFRNADYRIANLEMPLTNACKPIQKCGPNLMASTDTISAYCKLNVDLVTIANNHIMDQGKEGLESTCKTLGQAQIAYVGAGQCRQEACTPFIVQKDEKRIGIYACTEHEFSVATEKSAGANPFDPYESFDHVAELKNVCDWVIVLYHGGKEYYRYPSPNLQKTCRKFVEKGADIVLCQHSHCIGCEEEYKNGVIVYGQGNFIFDKREDEFWNNGLLIELELTDDIQIRYIPVIKNAETVRIASKVDRDEILSAFRLRSRQIMEKEFIEIEYKKFAEKMRNHYMNLLSGNRYALFSYKVLSKLSRGKIDAYIKNKLYQPEVLLSVINAIECEAHRELLLYGLKKRVKENK